MLYAVQPCLLRTVLSQSTFMGTSPDLFKLARDGGNGYGMRGKALAALAHCYVQLDSDGSRVSS